MKAINQEPPKVFVASTATLAARVITLLDTVPGRAARLDDIAASLERKPTLLYGQLRYSIDMGALVELVAPDGGLVMALKPDVTVEVDNELQLVSVGDRSELVGPIVHSWIPVGAPAPPVITSAPRSVFDLGGVNA